MSDFSDALADLNAARLEVHGVFLTLVSPGGMYLSFTGIRSARPLPDNSSPGAFESVWTRRTEFASLPVAGGTLLVESMEYVVQDVRPDPNPASDGITIYLNRKRPV